MKKVIVMLSNPDSGLKEMLVIGILKKIGFCMYQIDNCKFSRSCIEMIGLA